MATDTIERIRTSDLYYGAYLLASGSKLESVKLDKLNHRKIQFEFAGEDLRHLSGEYISGDAKVNLRLLKSSLDHLKDVIFEKLEGAYLGLKE